MLILTLTLLLSGIAVLLWYGSNKHQRLWRKPLAPVWRKLALVLAVFACCCAAWQLSHAAALFFCLLLLMLWLMLLPFATLLRRSAADEKH